MTSESLGFIVRQMDISKAAAALGKKGGAARTRAKIKAAKMNGKLGGRPRNPQKKAAVAKHSTRQIAKRV